MKTLLDYTRPAENGEQLVGADGKVFLASEAGKVTVLDPGPQWEIARVNDMGEEIWATPVITDGKLYVRTRSALYCFDE